MSRQKSSGNSPIISAGADGSRSDERRDQPCRPAPNADMTALKLQERSGLELV